MNRHKFKILSIDGGGIRGVIPCVILREIEKRTDKPIHRLFNLVAGTSTGAIIALGLTAPLKKDSKIPLYDAKQMLKFYGENRYTIFEKRHCNTLRSYFSPSYKGDNLFKILSNKFSNLELSDALIDTLITAYDSKEDSPFIFKKRLAKAVNPKNESELIENPLLCKLGRATSAAPTYFNPYVDNDSIWLDGGVFANNPSLLAYIEAKEISKISNSQNDTKDFMNESNKGIKTSIMASDDELPFFMLSLGTGRVDLSNADPRQGVGKLSWAKSVADTIMQGVSDTTHYEMKHLLPNYSDNETPRYVRINPEINKDLGEMDKADNYCKLIKEGLKYINQNSDEIQKICDILKS